MTKDFYIVRESCIQIHQEVTELLLVGKTIGEDLGLISDNELSTHEKTKSWDGMGRYAKEIYDDNAMLEKLKESSDVTHDAAELIREMKDEIDFLRNTLYRLLIYSTEEYIQTGEVDIPDHIDFAVEASKFSAKCRVIDHEQIKLKGRYQLILERIKRLS